MSTFDHLLSPEQLAYLEEAQEVEVRQAPQTAGLTQMLSSQAADPVMVVSSQGMANLRKALAAEASYAGGPSTPSELTHYMGVRVIVSPHLPPGVEAMALQMPDFLAPPRFKIEPRDEALEEQRRQRVAAYQISAGSTLFSSPSPWLDEADELPPSPWEWTERRR